MKRETKVRLWYYREIVSTVASFLWFLLAVYISYRMITLLGHWEYGAFAFLILISQMDTTQELQKLRRHFVL